MTSGGTFSQILRMGILARSIKDVITAFMVIKGPDGKNMSTLPMDLSLSPPIVHHLFLNRSIRGKDVQYTVNN